MTVFVMIFRMLQIGRKPIFKGISRHISLERRRKIQSFYFRNDVTIIMARFDRLGQNVPVDKGRCPNRPYTNI